MNLLDAHEFEMMRRSMLRSVGRMSSRSAKGFMVNLDMGLERAGLTTMAIKWRGGDDALFAVAGQFDGEPADCAARLLAALDRDVAFADAAATARVTPASVQVSFATWTHELGIMMVTIDAHRSAFR